jgi:hypothetical protein
MANLDGTLNGLIRLAIAGAVAAGVALTVFVVVNQMALDRDAADRRALVQRHIDLTVGAVAPGSPLSCLDAGAGDTVDTACEARVFADPRSAAAAVAYIGARLALLEEAAATQPAALKAMAASRRAIELDRYGIAAQVLSTRDGCTAERCAAFAYLTDTGVLKANMKAQAFEQYVSRHAAAWNAPPAPPGEPAPAAVSAAPQPPAAPQPVVAAAPLVAQPLSDKYTLPSAASIPPVSIMNTEPVLPKAVAEAQAAQFKLDGRPADALPPEARPGPKADEVPIPPKRPQAQADQAAPPSTVR